MQLIDLLKSFTIDEILSAIDEMFPETEQYQPIFREAYQLMLTLPLVASKKYIRYRVLTDEENEIEYFGAEDSCFNTTWEVCLAKELVVDDEVELTEVELTEVEIAANSLVNMCLIGRCPRQFLPSKNQLLQAE